MKLEKQKVTFEGETPELDIYHATFSSTGRTITHSGFKKIYQDVSEELEDQEDATILPDLEEGEKVTAKILIYIVTKLNHLPDSQKHH